MAAPNRVQLQSLTSLRFFAAIYVVIYHYWTSYHLSDARPILVELGETGVTFFFLLSGFILSYSYDAGGNFRKGALRRFYWARFARIYPVYIVTILIMLPALVSGKAADQQYRELWAITSPLAIHAWIPGAACSLNCPNWSISTEAFFYLLFPFVFAPVYRRPVLAIVLACVAMGAIWLIQIQAWLESGRLLADMKTVAFQADPRGDLLMQFFTYFPATRLPEFLFGIGLYGIWRRGAYRISPSLCWIAALLGGLLVLMTATWLPETILRTGVTIICYAPLIMAAANSRSGGLSQPSLVWLGQISFALYLVHSPVDSYLRTIDKSLLGSKLASMPFVFFSCAVIVALISAALLFHFLEEPARKAIMRNFPSTDNASTSARHRRASLDRSRPLIQPSREEEGAQS